MSHKAYKVIENAKLDLMAWAKERQIPTHRIEYVAAFEDWNDHLSVWIFFDTNSDRDKCVENGVVNEIKNTYLEILRKYEYPFDEFPKIDFEFDSHENVVKNFRGNYFYRLR